MMGSSPFGFDNFSFSQAEHNDSIRGDGSAAISFPLMIYEGSINYWRTRETIHLSIFEHQKISPIAPFPETSVCVEVVAFHPKFGIEAPHIYLSSGLLYEKFRRKEEEHSRKSREKGISHTTKKNVVKCNNKFTQDSIRDYVLARIGLRLGSNSLGSSSDSHDRPLSRSESEDIDAAKTFTIGFTPQLSDSDDGRIILENRPPCLGDLPIISQTRKDPEMIKQNFEKETMLHRIDTTIISEDCNKAEKMSDLASNTMKVFEAMMTKMLQKEEENMRYHSMPIARKRWSDAIRRILLQNKIAKMSVYIDDHYKKISTKDFVFKLPQQNHRRVIKLRKEFSPDFQLRLLKKAEMALKRRGKTKETMSEEKKEHKNEKGDKVEHSPFPIKIHRPERRSLVTAEETILIPHAKDNLFSNLSRVRRVTSNDHGTGTGTGGGASSVSHGAPPLSSKDIRDKLLAHAHAHDSIQIPRHSLTAPSSNSNSNGGSGHSSGHISGPSSGTCSGENTPCGRTPTVRKGTNGFGFSNSTGNGTSTSTALSSAPSAAKDTDNNRVKTANANARLPRLASANKYSESFGTQSGRVTPTLPYIAPLSKKGEVSKSSDD